MNLPFFAVEVYVPGGGVQNQAEKGSKNAFRPVPVPKFFFHENTHNSEKKTTLVANRLANRLFFGLPERLLVLFQSMLNF